MFWIPTSYSKSLITLSDELEFMFGVGPKRTRVGGEWAADFMFRPTPDRKYGWFLERPTAIRSATGANNRLL
jgi:hypothetical protein